MLKGISDIIWGPWTPLVFAIVGLYFTIKLKGFQITGTKYILKNTVGKMFEKDKGDGITPFRAMATALGGTIGVGNTVGVASAIISGGAGAVFWMIIAAFFGMIIKYAEIYLAIKFRTKTGGGAMYYIEKGLKCKWLAVMFSLICIFASFGMGNMAQSNAVSEYMQRSFKLSPHICGFFCALITLYIICGGMKRIGKLSGITVPFMAALYFIFGLIIIILNYRNIPSTITNIFTDAFSIKSASGGIGGFFASKAIRYGFARGMFSNEAGMGSSPTAHAASTETDPKKQAVWGIFEVFVDTVAVCGITALAILSSRLENPNPAGLVFDVFGKAFGSFGEIFLSISIVFFALASIFCWYVYGQAALDYLYKNKYATIIYRILFSTAVYIGASVSLDFIWHAADIFNGLMAIPNIIAIVALARYVK